MSQGPYRSRRPSDPRQAAEAAFKSATSKPLAPAPEPAPKPAAAPGAREMVTLRVEREVLEFFQEDGPGWQDRMVAALRKAAGK